ncbi:MAG: 2OG-Fe(II) oxygenase [Hyphomonas oceanitis]|uniref:2OG-Fe(II) oxygenase n=1 Tax=Hyphomonas oceanitis TaxID=81033 RepID=UPI0030010A61
MRVADIYWADVEAALDATGFASLGVLLEADARANLIGAYDQSAPYRSHVHMARHGFGRGQYKYFRYPLPGAIAALREALYPGCAAIANRWAERMRTDMRYPAEHADFLETCRAAGQTRPTPLILSYKSGDYNCLHQDLYGGIVFPLQIVILLSEEDDFDGGEFVMTEQRPRMQSRAHVVPLRAGEAVVFAVNERPVKGTRGDYRVKMRHGVSTLTRGARFATGIIFHEAT